MILLLFLIPLQPSPWQPGEGLRLCSGLGVHLLELQWWGDHTGGSHGQGHAARGQDPQPGPWGAWGARGPSSSCHIWRPGCQGDLGVQTGLQELPQGALKVEMAPAPPCHHSGEGFPYLPSLFSHCISLDISLGGLLEAGINLLPAAGRACLNFPTRFCGFWLADLCWFSSF